MAGYSPGGHKDSDTTEQTHTLHTHTHTHTHTKRLPCRVDNRLRETNTGGDKSFVVMTECLAMINFSCNLCSGGARGLKGPGSRAGGGCEP